MYACAPEAAAVAAAAARRRQRRWRLQQQEPPGAAAAPWQQPRPAAAARDQAAASSFATRCWRGGALQAASEAPSVPIARSAVMQRDPSPVGRRRVVFQTWAPKIKAGFEHTSPAVQLEWRVNAGRLLVG